MSIIRKKSHLYAAIASIAIGIGELFLTVWALMSTDNGWSFDVSNTTAASLALFIISLIFIVVGLIGSVAFGIVQIIEERFTERSYAGWLSVFVPYFFFTFFVNFTMWRRSGLTDVQFKDGVKKFNIENISRVVNALEDDKKFPTKLDSAFKELNELRSQRLLSEYEVNAFMYKLLVEKLGVTGLPVIYKEEEIFDLEVYK